MIAWANRVIRMLMEPKKLPTRLWIGILGLSVDAASRLEHVFKNTRISATQARVRVQKKLDDWDKNPDRLIKNAGDLLTMIDIKDIEPCIEEVRIGKSFEVLCTYEWKNTPLQDRKPTIYVPGFARRFKVPELPSKVNQDTGEAWKDQHVSRVFDFQFEPAFQAMSVMNPSVRFHGVDILVGRSTMLLLRQVAEGKDKQVFSLDLKMVAKTLCIHSKGSGRVAVPKQSYGRNFEEQFTEPIESAEDTNPDGYHRVLRYNLGPLTVVVRLEADAVLDEETAPARWSDDPNFQGKKTITPSSERLGISHARATLLIPGGHYIPQSLITELKTPSAGIEQTVKKAKPQLWAGQYDSVIVGNRKSGDADPNIRLTANERKEAAEKVRLEKEAAEAGGYAVFYSADIKDIRRDCKQWEDDNQASLQKLVGLLKGLVEIVSKVESGKVLLRKAERNGPLELFEGGEAMTDALPKEIIDVFWD